MPEGDTIHKAAAKLRPALVGKTVQRFEAARVVGSKPRQGVTVTEVEAVGKHLLVHFSDGHVLQTHLRMTGRWDLYRTGERWRLPAHLARAVIEVEDHVAVCFRAPVVQVHRGRPRHGDEGAGPGYRGLGNSGLGNNGHANEDAVDGDDAGALDAGDAPAGTWMPWSLRRAMENVGPDLCSPDADLDAALSRMRSLIDADTVVADVLLDQRIAAGVGNVFKSEVLWACEVHPLTPIGALDDDERRRLLETAAAQLRANLRPGPRTTVVGRPGSVAVYHRSRRPCRRCAATIRYAKVGATRRDTYWCPTCQVPPAR